MEQREGIAACPNLSIDLVRAFGLRAGRDVIKGVSMLALLCWPRCLGDEISSEGSAVHSESQVMVTGRFHWTAGGGSSRGRHVRTRRAHCLENLVKNWHTHTDEPRGKLGVCYVPDDQGRTGGAAVDQENGWKSIGISSTQISVQPPESKKGRIDQPTYRNRICYPCQGIFGCTCNSSGRYDSR